MLIQFKESQSSRLLQEIINQKKYVFTVEEVKILALELNISNRYLIKIISQLLGKNLIIRIRRGLYAINEQLYCEEIINPFVISNKLVFPSAISHWSAMQYYGFIESNPTLITAITPKKIVTPSMRKQSKEKVGYTHSWRIQNINYKYISIKPNYYFGVKKIQLNKYFGIFITDKERTLLDALIYAKDFGGTEKIFNLIKANYRNIDTKKLIKYSIQYNKKMIAKHLQNMFG